MNKFYTHKVSEDVYNELKRRDLNENIMPTYAEVLDRLQSMGFRVSIAQIDGVNLVGVIVKKGSHIKFPTPHRPFFEALDKGIFTCFEMLDNENIR